MEQLFLELYAADDEQEITEIIARSKVLSEPSNWAPYGESKGNFGIFENQQNHPVPALVEKITNSIDATLMKECLKSGIDPKADGAPHSMAKAVELFFGVKDGEIGELGAQQRRKLAENIQVIATGDRKSPSITVYDNGEGQSPNEFTRTFLSLNKNNKVKIPFVQGKYNMGSTGAVVFCGESKYQLIGSKRCTELISNEDSNEFGFTLVRRHPLSGDEETEYGKATWYEYFCPDGDISSFNIESLDLGLYGRKFESGSIVKLFSYQLPRGTRSDVTLDLWRDLNQYMYHLPIPVSVYEKREGYASTKGEKGRLPNKPVLGNRTRITIDSRDKVEKIVSFSIPASQGFGEIPIYAIIFNSSVDHGEFIKNKSIIFTQNGQVHGYEGQTFISQYLGLSLLKKHMLIHVDCTEIPTSVRQDLFMSNRTHMKQGPKTDKLRDLIVKQLKTSKELRKLNSQRKESLLQDSSDDRDLVETFLSKLPVDQDVVQLLKNDGSLNFLKQQGKVTGQKSKTKKERPLNRFPSIFKLNLKTDPDGKPYKTVPLNQTGIVEIKTDVDNDYLFRPTDKGKFKLEILQRRPQEESPVNPNPNPTPNDVSDIIDVNREGPNDGTIKLLITPNSKAEVDDQVQVRATLSSPGEDFECIFDVKVDKEIVKPKQKEQDSQNETFPDLPVPQKAFENPTSDKHLKWSNPNLQWSGEDIVKVLTEKNSGSNQLAVTGIIVNMDSFVLKRFLSKNKITSEDEIRFQTDRYFLSIYLHSLFLFSIFLNMWSQDEQLEKIDVEEFISNMIKPYASFLLYENYHVTKHVFDE